MLSGGDTVLWVEPTVSRPNLIISLLDLFSVLLRTAPRGSARHDTLAPGKINVHQIKLIYSIGFHNEANICGRFKLKE